MRRPKSHPDRAAYYDYIRSTAWRERRDEFARAYEDRCMRCGWEGRGLSVHHLTYERLGAELDEDLELLCSVCHGQAHRWRPPFRGVVQRVRSERPEPPWELRCDECGARSHDDFANHCYRCYRKLNAPGQPEGVFPRRRGEPDEEYERRWQKLQEELMPLSGVPGDL